MQLELELVRKQHKHFGLPLRESLATNERIPAEEMIARRRVVRAETDDLLTCAMENANLPRLAMHLTRVAFVTAGACAQFGLNPDVGDFIEALRESIAIGRKELDDALRLQDWQKARTTVVIMELTWRGAAAALNLPYEKILAYTHNSYLANEPVTEDAVKQIIDLWREDERA